MAVIVGVSATHYLNIDSLALMCSYGNPMKPLGFTDRLRAARHKARLRQEDVAKALAVTVATVANHERGRTEPDLATLAALATLYRVSVDWLLGRTVALHPPSIPGEEPPTDKGARCNHAIPIGERCLQCEAPALAKAQPISNVLTKTYQKVD